MKTADSLKSLSAFLSLLVHLRRYHDHFPVGGPGTAMIVRIDRIHVVEQQPDVRPRARLLQQPFPVLGRAGHARQARQERPTGEIHVLLGAGDRFLHGRECRFATPQWRYFYARSHWEGRKLAALGREKEVARRRSATHQTTFSSS